MKILGIESSCDETAAAIIKGSKNDTKVNVLSNVIASSLSLHTKTGGIIPDVLPYFDETILEEVFRFFPVAHDADDGAKSGGDQPPPAAFWAYFHIFSLFSFIWKEGVSQKSFDIFLVQNG